MNTLKDYIRDDIALFLDGLETIEEVEENRDELLDEIMESIQEVIYKILQ